MMAIPPNDEVDNLNTTKDLVDEQVIEEKPVQVAMANNVGRKVSRKTVIDGAKKLIDEYTETEGKKKGEIRQPDILEGEEALKKQKQKQLEDAQKKEDNIKKMQEGGIESPLINVEESGKVYIRPATQDELKKEIYSKDVSLQNTFKTSQPLKNNKTKYSSDKGDVVVPNLKNIKTRWG